MRKEQLAELQMIIEQSSIGNYTPLLIVAGVIVFCFTLLITLLINWYKKDQRITDQRLNEHSEIMKQLTETTTELKEISKYHEKDIERLKDHA